jgi:hypothetical protein
MTNIDSIECTTTLKQYLEKEHENEHFYSEYFNLVKLAVNKNDTRMALYLINMLYSNKNLLRKLNVGEFIEIIDLLLKNNMISETILLTERLVDLEFTKLFDLNEYLIKNNQSKHLKHIFNKSDSHMVLRLYSDARALEYMSYTDRFRAILVELSVEYKNWEYLSACLNCRYFKSLKLNKNTSKRLLIKILSDKKIIPYEEFDKRYTSLIFDHMQLDFDDDDIISFFENSNNINLNNFQYLVEIIGNKNFSNNGIAKIIMIFHNAITLGELEAMLKTCNPGNFYYAVLFSKHKQLLEQCPIIAKLRDRYLKMYKFVQAKRV